MVCPKLSAELLNDIAADRTGPSDGEFRVSRHELILCTVCAHSAGHGSGTIYLGRIVTVTNLLAGFR